MWLYRLIQAMRLNFPWWLMGILIIEGFFGLMLMFIFPPGALGMVFLGLLTLLLSGLIKSGLAAMERLVAGLLGIKTTPPSPGEPKA